MLTIAAAAEAAGVHVAWIQRMCRLGLLPHYRFTKGLILIDPDELDGFLASGDEVQREQK
jgi:excisionase family DNA binding protein